VSATFVFFGEALRVVSVQAGLDNKAITVVILPEDPPGYRS
jgi:hypothetical protein